MLLIKSFLPVGLENPTLWLIFMKMAWGTQSAHEGAHLFFLLCTTPQYPADPQWSYRSIRFGSPGLWNLLTPIKRTHCWVVLTYR